MLLYYINFLVSHLLKSFEIYSPTTKFVNRIILLPYILQIIDIIVNCITNYWYCILYNELFFCKDSIYYHYLNFFIKCLILKYSNHIILINSKNNFQTLLLQNKKSKKFTKKLDFKCTNFPHNDLKLNSYLVYLLRHCYLCPRESTPDYLLNRIDLKPVLNQE